MTDTQTNNLAMLNERLYRLVIDLAEMALMVNQDDQFFGITPKGRDAAQRVNEMIKLHEAGKDGTK